MKGKTGKVSTKRRNYFSFMFVPHRKGSVKTIRINNFRTTFLSLTAILLVALLTITGYTLSLAKENKLLKAKHDGEIQLLTDQKNKLEEYIANQTNELIENAELISEENT